LGTAERAELTESCGVDDDDDGGGAATAGATGKGNGSGATPARAVVMKSRHSGATTVPPVARGIGTRPTA
jgi:hypothetical protein